MVVASDKGELPPGVHWALWSFALLWLVAAPGLAVRPIAVACGHRPWYGEAAESLRLGSFVTAKPCPRDLDILLIMEDDFESGTLTGQAQALFDPIRARLLFEADVLWARASIGDEMLDLWLDTYQTSREFRKRGIVELELR